MFETQQDRRSILRAAVGAGSVPLTVARAEAQVGEVHSAESDIDEPIRALISLPDSRMVREAQELARETCPPFLFNHVMRAWIFGASLSKTDGVKQDPELLAVSALLHDLGLTDKYTTQDNRFEVDGANAARAFLRSYKLAEADVQLVWDAISLHTTRTIALHKGPVVALCHSGVQVDVSGIRSGEISPALMEQVLRAYPRLSFKKDLTNCLCEIVRRKPATTYDNFIHDFGDRYVPGYKALSSVDRLNNAPYES